MKLNLLVDNTQSQGFGPGRRAINLMQGLDLIGHEYELCGNDFEYAVGMQAGPTFNRWKLLPRHVPIGPNVFHDLKGHKHIAKKFKNFIVQSEWVADYYNWTGPAELVKDKNIYIWAAGVDIEEIMPVECKNKDYDCLYYVKYQNNENEASVKANIFDKFKQKSLRVEYGEYEHRALPELCSHAKYAVFHSCCEKSPHALLELLACGLPVYVIDSRRWIGDDRFDRATSAPYFDERCGIKGNHNGDRFSEFLDNLDGYKPREFVTESFTLDKIARQLVRIVEECIESKDSICPGGTE